MYIIIIQVKPVNRNSSGHTHLSNYNTNLRQSEELFQMSRLTVQCSLSQSHAHSSTALCCYFCSNINTQSIQQQCTMQSFKQKSVQC